MASPANLKTLEGQPQFLVQNIPPTSTASELSVTQPDIYYGEGQPGSYSLVDSKQQELDYSTPAGDVYARYQGTGGVPIGGFVHRLLFAWRFANINILISGLVTKDTKIMYFRQIQERLQKAAPFLSWDTDPYPVIADGRLVWIADGYTVSNMYPYSESTDLTDRTTRQTSEGTISGIPGSFNYIRNSVKATIDAYNGTVKLYIWDPNDPVIEAWAKSFPNVFSDASSMPATIAAHVRYPEDLFSVQTFVYQKYHVTDPATFFAQGDVWAIPPDPNQANPPAAVQSHAQEIQPYYVLMQLPGDTAPSYELILPMNPQNKQNMISLIAARSSPVVGGQQLVDLHFPPGALVDGVTQVHARINANQDISTAKTLLGQLGSTVNFGNLLVVPLADSLIYVEPMIVEAQSNAVPLLEYVIAATSNRVTFATTLQDALTSLVSGQPAPTGTVTTTPPPTPGTPSIGGGAPVPPAQSLAQQALTHLQNYQAAVGRGDFTTAGQELAALQKLLQASASPSPAPSGSAAPSGASGAGGAGSAPPAPAPSKSP